jgi:hypothetical protein
LEWDAQMVELWVSSLEYWTAELWDVQKVEMMAASLEMPKEKLSAKPLVSS